MADGLEDLVVAVEKKKAKRQSSGARGSISARSSMRRSSGTQLQSVSFHSFTVAAQFPF
jgi:hypothetical protein